MRPISNKQPDETATGEESKMIAEDKDIFDFAPHVEQEVSKALTSKESILSEALPGDYLRFMKNIGGGGAHRLYVTDFQTIIQMFPNERNLRV